MTPELRRETTTVEQTIAPILAELRVSAEHRPDTLQAVAIYEKAGLSASRAYDLELTAARILTYARTTVVLIGQELRFAHEATHRGGWKEFLARVEMDEKTARNYMNVAEQFANNPELVKALKPTALYLLAAPGADPVVVEQIVRDVEQGKPAPSVAEVKQRLAKIVPTKEQVVSVRCAYCGAKPGKDCITGPGFPLGYTHNLRADAARKMLAKAPGVIQDAPKPEKPAVVPLCDRRVAEFGITSATKTFAEWGVGDEITTHDGRIALTHGSPAAFGNESLGVTWLDATEEELLEFTRVKLTDIGKHRRWARGYERKEYVELSKRISAARERKLAADAARFQPAPVTATYAPPPVVQPQPTASASLESFIGGSYPAPQPAPIPDVFGPEPSADERVLSWHLEGMLLDEMIAMHLTYMPPNTSDMEVQPPEDHTLRQYARDALIKISHFVAALKGDEF